MSRREATALRGLAWRLAITVWLVYCVHFASNVVRETYLAISLGESLSVRVDPYLGLHPDLFAIPGRGAYINNNPGASMLGAVPYALARPAIALVFALKPELAQPKPPASYADPRPNRTKFVNLARERGLDIKLGLAALSMQVGLMAPLGALAALIVFFFLRARLGSEREATMLALLYAFGTPIFFRSAFLNQNAIIAHLVLAAYVCLVGWEERAEHDPIPRRNLLAIGALLGLGLVCDYSAVPFLLVFGLWIIGEGWGRGGPAGAARYTGSYVLGAVPPMLLLFAYQWAAFGNPIFPAQRYMPPTEFSVRGWLGFSLPTTELMAGNLVDVRYGLFAFCPMLILAFAAPFLRRRAGGPTTRELGWIFAAFGALYLFSSANQFANLQWNTGVRYMVPAVPLLFVAMVPVLRAMPSAARIAIVGVTLVISWSVSMARESVSESLAMIFREGPMLPVFTVLQKMATGYSSLQPGRLAPLGVLLAVAVTLWAVWRRAAPEASSAR